MSPALCLSGVRPAGRGHENEHPSGAPPRHRVGPAKCELDNANDNSTQQTPAASPADAPARRCAAWAPTAQAPVRSPTKQSARSTRRQSTPRTSLDWASLLAQQHSLRKAKGARLGAHQRRHTNGGTPTAAHQRRHV